MEEKNARHLSFNALYADTNLYSMEPCFALKEVFGAFVFLGGDSWSKLPGLYPPYCSTLANNGGWPVHSRPRWGNGNDTDTR